MQPKWAGNETGRWPWGQSSPHPTAVLAGKRTRGEGSWEVSTEGQWPRCGDNSEDSHSFPQNVEVWTLGGQRAGGGVGGHTASALGAVVSPVPAADAADGPVLGPVPVAACAGRQELGSKQGHASRLPSGSATL